KKCLWSFCCKVVVCLLLTICCSVADTEVFCVVMESCILPCSFQGDTDVVIHWIQVTAGNSPVHSFYHNKDQLTHQDQRFSGRTSLFTDQISGGNLTGLQVQDQGRYKCYTSSNRGNNDSYINLKVEGEKHTVNIVKLPQTAETFIMTRLHDALMQNVQNCIKFYPFFHFSFSQCFKHWNNDPLRCLKVLLQESDLEIQPKSDRPDPDWS
uniref:Ig-like domain-containing protein n=1 Tax=Seriola dumerili TaxID=41447 RepID=A0A3B4VQB5_SERDU